MWGRTTKSTAERTAYHQPTPSGVPRKDIGEGVLVSPSDTQAHTAELTPARFRVRFLFIFLNVLGLGLALLGSIVLLTSDETLERAERFATLACLWGTVCMLWQSLVEVLSISISSRGIGRHRILGTKWIPWANLDGIFWRHASGSAGAKSIFLQLPGQTIAIQDNVFDLGEVPMIDAIHQAWHGVRGDHAPPRFVRPKVMTRWLLRGAGITIATALVAERLSALGLAPFSLVDLTAFSVLALCGTLFTATMTALEQSKRLSTGVSPIEVDDPPDLARALDQATLPQCGQRAADAFLRWAFRTKTPVDPGIASEPGSGHRFRRLDRRNNVRFGTTLLTLGTAGLAILITADRWWYPPSPTEVFENRRSMYAGLAIASFGLSVPLTAFLVIRYARRREGPDFEFHTNFTIAMRGYDPNRAAVWVCLCASAFGAFAGVSSWGSRELIDGEGVHFKSGMLTSDFRPYESVRAIQLEPNRRGQGFRLLIRFDQGPSFRSQFSWTVDRWKPILDHLQQRTGLSISSVDE